MNKRVKRLRVFAGPAFFFDNSKEKTNGSINFFTEKKENQIYIFENNNQIPFIIKRTYWIYDVPESICKEKKYL